MITFWLYKPSLWPWQQPTFAPHSSTWWHITISSSVTKGCVVLKRSTRQNWDDKTGTYRCIQWFQYNPHLVNTIRGHFLYSTIFWSTQTHCALQQTFTHIFNIYQGTNSRLSQNCPCCCFWNNSSVVWLTMDVRWVSFFLFSNSLTNSEEIRFSRSSSLFCPALDAINFSCRKKLICYSHSWGRHEHFGSRSIVWCSRNISTADQLWST